LDARTKRPDIINDKWSESQTSIQDVECDLPMDECASQLAMYLCYQCRRERTVPHVIYERDSDKLDLETSSADPGVPTRYLQQVVADKASYYAHFRSWLCTE